MFYQFFPPKVFIFNIYFKTQNVRYKNYLEFTIFSTGNTDFTISFQVFIIIAQCEPKKVIFGSQFLGKVTLLILNQNIKFINTQQ